VTKLPSLSGQKCAKALGRLGFELRRQEGSHMILRRGEPFCQVVVPDHKELDRGTLRVLRQAQVGVEDFVRLL
jgi:predicted RNA binding protein YcfA (HicA-like mRNA interferase family)